MTATSRHFLHHHLLIVTDAAHQRASELLARRAVADFAPIRAVIAVANGGLPPAGLIAGALSVPLLSVAARHNLSDAVYTQATGRVTFDLTDLAAVRGRHDLRGTVLVVDDICGSGATFATLLPALHRELGPATTLRTVVLCRNTGAPTAPDLWVWNVDDWVTFPWEAPPPPAQPIRILPVPLEVLSA